MSSRNSTGPVATLAFTVLIRSRTKLDACLNALNSVSGVVSAVRADTSSGAVQVTKPVLYADKTR